MSSNTKEFSEGSFQADVLDSDKPVLVDFWSEWCGPFKMLTPTINEVADDFQGKATIGKLNVDDHPTIASNYGIRSIPSLLFFKDGKVQNQIMGAVSKSDIEQALNDIID